jgi:O-antigen/teichoic acid export membrane protein
MGWIIPLLPTLVLGSFFIYQQFGGQVNPSLDMFLIIQGMALGLVAAWSWIEIYFNQIQSKQLIGEVGKALWSFNRWTASANLGQFVVYRLQYLYMFRVLGPAELGIYSVAVVVAEGAWVITQTFSTVLLSSLSAHQGPPDEHQVRRSWGWSLQAFLWTLLPVVVLLLIPIKWLSLVLGSSYTPVHGLWIALSPGILALACSNVLVQHFTALGRVKVSFFSSWGTAVLILCGMVPAFHFAGAQGIAWWTSLVLVANTVGLLAFFRMTYKAYL